MGTKKKIQSPQMKAIICLSLLLAAVYTSTDIGTTPKDIPIKFAKFIPFHNKSRLLTVTTPKVPIWINSGGKDCYNGLKYVSTNNTCGPKCGLPDTNLVDCFNVAVPCALTKEQVKDVYVYYTTMKDWKIFRDGWCCDPWTTTCNAWTGVNSPWSLWTGYGWFYGAYVVKGSH